MSRSSRPVVLACVLFALAVLVAAPAAAQDAPEAPATDPPGEDLEPLPEDAPQVVLQPFADGFTAPLRVAEPPDGSDRKFIVDQIGAIRIVTADGDVLREPFLDVADKLVRLDPQYDERGLLGLAFHPDYAENGRFFIYYSAPAQEGAAQDWDHTSHVSEYRVDPDDPDRADPGSERVIMRIDQPFSNHNAGGILFGDDGYLYIPLGDGGNGGDADPEGDDRDRPPRGNAQTTSTLLGSVLRVDVDGAEPYQVPENNPFVDGGGREEIYAYGLRNPYGFTKDLETGDLYAAEAGQMLFEELNRIELGGNYGWNIKEGLSCFNGENQSKPLADCRDTGYDGEPLTDPVVVYERAPDVGSTIVPGVRYRGERIPDLEGDLVFGDYARIRFKSEGVVYVASETDDGPWDVREARVSGRADGRDDGRLNRFLLGIDQDADGEIYALTTERGGPEGQTGEVFALYGPDEAPSAWPWWAWAGLGLAVAAIGLLSLLGWRRNAAQRLADKRRQRE